MGSYVGIRKAGCYKLCRLRWIHYCDTTEYYVHNKQGKGGKNIAHKEELVQIF